MTLQWTFNHLNVLISIDGSTMQTNMGDQQYFELRSRAVKRMKETDNPNPFPHKFNVTYDLRNFERDFSYLSKGQTIKDRTISVGCRIFNIRRAGDNLRFYEVAVDGAEIQIMAQAQEATGTFPPVR